jgi:hypothetical protein
MTMPTQAVPAAPIPEPDWLDRLGAWCLEKLADLGAWCLAKIAALVETVGAFLLYHWILVTIIGLSFMFFRRIVEWQAVTTYAIKTKAQQAVEHRRQEIADQAQRQMAARFEAMSDGEFGQLTGRLKVKIALHRERWIFLDGLADRSHFETLASTHRKNAAEHAEKVQALEAELDRLERLWQFTHRGRNEKREREQHARVYNHVLDLIDQLASGDDASARDALAKLNTLRSTFDWNSLIPPAMSDAEKTRVLQLLQIMAGTSQLGEARSAFGFVQRMFSDHNLSWWAKMAA